MRTAIPGVGGGWEKTIPNATLSLPVRYDSAFLWAPSLLFHWLCRALFMPGTTFAYRRVVVQCYTFVET